MKRTLQGRQSRRKFITSSVLAGSALLTPGALLFSRQTEAASLPLDPPAYAKQRFLKSMNCSQAILETFAPLYGVDVETARRIAAAFAGGMGMGTECGAVTGAFMVIGLAHGKVADHNGAADKKTFEAVSELVGLFKKQHLTISCSELLDSDMSTPEGVKSAADKGYFTSRCPEYVYTSATILQSMMA